MSDSLLHAGLPAILEAAQVNARAATSFGLLSAEQINWTPDAREWTIGQCFHHLILSHEPFTAILDGVLKGDRRVRLWERIPFVPALFGRLLIQSLDPRSGRKLKARPAFHPSHQRMDPGIVSRFLDQHERLVERMGATSHLALDRIIVTSPVAGLVTYSLIDAYRIIVTHEQNHLDQAQGVRDARGFPG